MAKLKMESEKKHREPKSPAVDMREDRADMKKRPPAKKKPAVKKAKAKKPSFPW